MHIPMIYERIHLVYMRTLKFRIDFNFEVEIEIELILFKSKNEFV